MKFLLLNTNPIVQKLVEITAKKAGANLTTAQSANQIDDVEHYDYFIIDNECVDKALLKSVEKKRKCLIYDRRGERISGFDDYIEKPFLPTTVLDVLKAQIERDLAERRIEGEDTLGEQMDAALAVENAPKTISLDNLDEGFEELDAILAGGDLDGSADLELQDSKQTLQNETLDDNKHTQNTATNIENQIAKLDDQIASTQEEAQISTQDNQAQNIDVAKENQATSIESSDEIIESAMDLDNDDLQENTIDKVGEVIDEPKVQNTPKEKIEAIKSELETALAAEQNAQDEDSTSSQSTIDLANEDLEIDIGDLAIDDSILDKDLDAELDVFDDNIGDSGAGLGLSSERLLENDLLNDVKDIELDDTPPKQEAVFEPTFDIQKETADDVAYSPVLDSEQIDEVTKALVALETQETSQESDTKDKLDDMDISSIQSDITELESPPIDVLNDTKADVDDLANDTNEIETQKAELDALYDDATNRLDDLGKTLNTWRNSEQGEQPAKVDTAMPLEENDIADIESLNIPSVETEMPHIDNNEALSNDDTSEDFATLSEPEVAQALGENIENEIENIAQNANIAQDTQEIPLSMSKDIQNQAPEVIKDVITNSIESSLSTLSTSNLKSVLDGLEVTINISFKDKNK